MVHSAVSSPSVVSRFGLAVSAPSISGAAFGCVWASWFGAGARDASYSGVRVAQSVGAQSYAWVSFGAYGYSVVVAPSSVALWSALRACGGRVVLVHSVVGV